MDSEPNSMEELKQRQNRETEDFILKCHHTDVIIEDGTGLSRGRDITIRCRRCRLNLLTYHTDLEQSYLSYVRDCVNGHPGSRKRGEQLALRNSIRDVLFAQGASTNSVPLADKVMEIPMVRASADMYEALRQLFLFWDNGTPVRPGSLVVGQAKRAMMAAIIRELFPGIRLEDK